MRMPTSVRPPSRKSTSATVAVNPAGPHHRRISSGSLQASQARATGAFMVRDTENADSPAAESFVVM